jgi:hypothetical protein
MKQFDSELNDFPGSFSIPDPMLDRHMRVWWEEAVVKVKGVPENEYEFYDAEWKAAIALINGFGAWNVEGVPPGDLLTDGVPIAVKAWVKDEVDAYLLPFLPLRLKRRLLGIT